MKKLLYILLLFSHLSLFSQTTNLVTTYTLFEISCLEYVNNMNQTWEIDIPVNHRLSLDYSVRVEHSYDKVLIYSIDNAGNAVLQTTLTGSQTGTIRSLYPNGKMRVVFTSDISINCSTNPAYSGFRIVITKPEGISYAYDASGNRVSRDIVLGYPAYVRSDTGEEEEEIVFSEKIGYLVDEERQEATISIYPNPTEGRFSVKIDNVADEISGQIYLLDTNGRLVDKKMIRSEREIDFDLSREATGVYILNMHLGENTSTWRIIKK